MPKITIDDELRKKIDDKSPQEILKWARYSFDSIAISISFQLGGIVLIDMAKNNDLDFRVFTIDTGRLHEETYQMMDTIRKTYNIEIEIYFPDFNQIEELVRKKGVYSFRDSIDNRKECCYIRKEKPLERALSGLDAWVTGLRKSQSETRSNVSAVEIDKAHNNIVKINPLANWTEQNILDYTKENNLPVHPLYERGYASVGCESCTRPGIGREGRWWWELKGKKECGIHYDI